MEVAAPLCPPRAGLRAFCRASLAALSQARPVSQFSLCLPVMSAGTGSMVSRSRVAGGNLRELCIPKGAGPGPPTWAPARPQLGLIIFRSALATHTGSVPAAPRPCRRLVSCLRRALGPAQEVLPVLCFCSYPAYSGFGEKSCSWLFLKF